MGRNLLYIYNSRADEAIREFSSHLPLASASSGDDNGYRHSLRKR